MRWFFMVLAAMASICLHVDLVRAEHAAADYVERAEVARFIEELSDEHQFSRKDLALIFSDAKYSPEIIKSISRPAEKTKKWHEYRNIFLDQARIDKGVEFWNLHTDTLAKAQQEFSVPAEILVAIIGVETRYGTRAGTHKVLDALSTLGFDYPPREKFFRNELKEFLLLSREEHKDPREALGSYAGAMGYGQFMPSSFRAYAVDYDGDDLRDIWGNPVDAIGSVGNYLNKHGWRANTDIVFLATEVDDAVFQALANRQLKPDFKIAQLKHEGRLSAAELADDAEVALFRMQAEDKVEYWLGLHNFYVITRYNHSRMYALAVYQLAMEIASARAFSKSQAPSKTQALGK